MKGHRARAGLWYVLSSMLHMPPNSFGGYMRSTFKFPCSLLKGWPHVVASQGNVCLIYQVTFPCVPDLLQEGKHKPIIGAPLVNLKRTLPYFSYPSQNA